MADYEYPKVTVLEGVYDVTKIYQKKGATAYSTVQGHTVSTGKNRVHFFTALETEDGVALNNHVAVARVMGEQDDKGEVDGAVSKNRSLGHANDCAYYNSGYFVAQGGGDYKSTNIKCLNNSLEHVATYAYKPMTSGSCDALEDITAIAHISGKYFALSKGLRVSICELDTGNKYFEEKSRFKLTGIGDHLSRGREEDYERLPQGIYCTDSVLYKVFSYKNKSTKKIKWNDIGVFKFNSNTPSKITKAAFQTSYSCDREGKALFEVESISSPNGGSTMYMLANVDDSGEKDKLYKVSFS